MTSHFPKCIQAILTDHEVDGMTRCSVGPNQKEAVQSTRFAKRALETDMVVPCPNH
jgi:hypothetical protein